MRLSRFFSHDDLGFPSLIKRHLFVIVLIPLFHSCTNSGIENGSKLENQVSRSETNRTNKALELGSQIIGQLVAYDFSADQFAVILNEKTQDGYQKKIITYEISSEKKICSFSLNDDAEILTNSRNLWDASNPTELIRIDWKSCGRNSTTLEIGNHRELKGFRSVGIKNIPYEPGTNSFYTVGEEMISNSYETTDITIYGSDGNKIKTIELDEENDIIKSVLSVGKVLMVLYRKYGSHDEWRAFDLKTGRYINSFQGDWSKWRNPDFSYHNGAILCFPNSYKAKEVFILNTNQSNTPIRIETPFEIQSSALWKDYLLIETTDYLYCYNWKTNKRLWTKGITTDRLTSSAEIGINHPFNFVNGYVVLQTINYNNNKKAISVYGLPDGSLKKEWPTYLENHQLVIDSSGVILSVDYDVHSGYSLTAYSTSNWRFHTLALNMQRTPIIIGTNKQWGLLTDKDQNSIFKINISL